MDSRIKEEKAELSFESAGDNPASISLIEKYDLFLKDDLSEDSDEDTEELIKNQMKNCQSKYATTDNDLFVPCFVPRQQPNLDLDEPLRQLEAVRKTGDDGNSIFCTQSEFEAIAERYEDIISFIADKRKLFSEVNSSDESNSGAVTAKQNDDIPEALIDKIKSVQQARDKLYDIENQVREQIEQLELVERYKMED